MSHAELIERDELAPCPFCGSDAETDFIPERSSFRIECSVLNCCTGPICDSENAAIIAWNARNSGTRSVFVVNGEAGGVHD